MVAQQSCAGPVFCLTVTGECCLLVLDRGRVLCPLSCSDDTNRQSQQQSGYTMNEIFGVTFVSTLLYNVLNNIGATTTTTTTAPTFTSSISKLSLSLINM